MAKMHIGALCAGATLLLSANAMSRTCKTTSDFWPYEVKKEMENADILFYADLYLERSCEEILAEAKAGSNGTLYDMSAELVEAKAIATLKGKEEVTVKGDVIAMGYSLGDFNHTQSTALKVADKMSYPLEINDKKYFMVGPVPVKVQYGLIGEAGLDYQATLDLGSAILDANPYVDSKVFATAGVDVKIARVDATGDVILIKDTMTNHIALELDQVDFETITLDALGYNKVDALRGQITASAVSDTFGMEHTRELVSWNGFTREDQAFRVELDYPTPF